MTATLTPTATRVVAPGVARFAGTWQLLRLALRRDRVLVPVWIAVFVLSAASSAAATVGLYPTEAGRVQVAETINANASIVALYGPVLDPTSIGQVSLFKMSALGAALVGLLAVFLVARHTRGEEEVGRTELIGAGVVGRWAALAAALLEVVGTLVVLCLVTAGSLVGAGLDATGSLSFGLSWLVTGLVLTGVAAVAVQVASTSRGSKALAGAVLGLAYLVRGVADGAPDGELAGLRWASPVGWAQEVRAFSDPRWAVGALALAAGGALVVLAFALVDRRDLGAGMLADRAGVARAPRSLTGTLGLALRLHRGALWGWALGAGVLSLVVGGLLANVGGFLDESARSFIESLGGQQRLEDAFMATEFAFIGLFFSAFAIATVLRLRSEETAGRAELLLAHPVTRWRWGASHVLVALGGAAALLLVTGVLTGFSSARATGDDAWWGKVAQAAAVQAPAIGVMVGITLVAVALVPRAAAGVAWGLFAVFLLLGEVGPLLELPSWAMDLSPFAHTPQLPGQGVSLVPLVWLGLAAAALVAGGLVALRRRDLAA
jgi:ABC-2 type transport system permease protein